MTNTEVTIESLFGIPYVVMEQHPVKGPSEEVTLRLLYCHGNSEDVTIASIYMQTVLDSLHARFPSWSIYLVIWDYPTFSISRDTDQSVEHITEQGNRMWQFVSRLGNDTPIKLNWLVGYSIGTHFAARVASLPMKQSQTCHSLILIAPFARLCTGTGRSVVASIIGEIYDNVSVLRSVPRLTTIRAIGMEFDEQLPLQMNTEIRPRVDQFITFPDASHDYCTTVAGSRHLANQLAQWAVSDMAALVHSNEKDSLQLEPINDEKVIDVDTRITSSTAETFLLPDASPYTDIELAVSERSELDQLLETKEIRAEDIVEWLIKTDRLDKVD